MIGQEQRYKQVKALQQNTNRIRNISIVAHVDHGKTTLADCLIASNGIIHRKQAGQLKLLDDRLDEQDRGITMKASSIALLHKDHLINLIDSPGHLEFYSEVSAALRLTDAALLVVDTVEGVSSQTYRVLQQLYTQKLPSILILNKIDKLITSCKMEPLQAFLHLSQLIEHVNAILGSFIAKEMTITRKNSNSSESKQSQKKEGEPIDTLEKHFYFSPSKKNVIFASSLDNWGFAVESFSPLISKKMGKQPQQIEKYLWGEYYYNSKSKMFTTEPKSENDRPLCVDLIIKPVWDIFEFVESQNFEKLDKITNALGIKISQSAKKAKGYALIKQVLNTWLPLDKIVMDRIITQLPDPVFAQKFRLPYLLKLNSGTQVLSPRISKALELCSHSEAAPLIGFVSKMITIPKKQLSERGYANLGNEADDCTVLGFTRLFSGKICRGQEILVIGAKPKKIENEHGEIKQVPDISKVKITGLYFFNGQFPEAIEEAYGGCVVGIGGLENAIFKSGTISTLQQCISFIPISSQTKSILKVSVSTADIRNNGKLLDGLKKLNRSDPSVDVYVEGTGDIILSTCGQVHLEKCVVDLEKIYCKIPISISEPIITLRETATWQTLKETKNQKYLQEIEKKKQEKQKKAQKEQFKAEMLADAEMDEIEKQKLRAVREWDSHVQIYGSEDLTVEDTRFFFKSRDDTQQQKEAFLFKREKEVKKFDHKNKGKMHLKQKFLNLNLKTNVAKIVTPNNKLALTVRALGMPFAVAEYLEKNGEKMQKIFSEPVQNAEQHEDKERFQMVQDQRKEFIEQFMNQLTEEKIEETIQDMISDKLVCFGPTLLSGTNLLLVDCIKPNQSFFKKAIEGQIDEKYEFNLDQKVCKILEENKTTVTELFQAIKNGFWLACGCGPLVNEQMMGLIFILQKIEAVSEEEEKTQSKLKEEQQKKQQIHQTNEHKTQKAQNQQQNWKCDNFGPLAGLIISTMKDACIQSFLGASPRLVEPMYLCELHTHQQYYGSIYSQLSKRRAQVISEDLHQFSNFFIIKAYLPLLESHNFCFDILDKTQGTVNAQLDLDTWKIIEEDPFYVPLTLQQIQQQGLESKNYNQARLILEKIRHKKGLAGTEKIVVAAEKQRTLKKN